MPVIGVLAASAASAAEFYVDPAAGKDSNDGSLKAPLARLNQAVPKLMPGDTLLLRKGVYRDDWIFTTRDGAGEKPIVIRAYPGESPVITGSGRWDQILHLNHSHYEIRGLTFEDTQCQNVVYVNASRHNTIRDCTFRRQTGTMVLIRGGGHHTIEKNAFDTAGTPSDQGHGNHIYVAGSHHNLIQENRFFRAGHSAVDQLEAGDENSHHNILRNNLVEQPWGSGFGVIRRSYRSLIENNRIFYAGREMEYPKCGIQLAGCDNIVRRNVVAHTGANPYMHNGLLIAGYNFNSIPQHAMNNRVYHNVFYKIGRTAFAVSQAKSCKTTNNVVMNNIAYQCRAGGPKERWWPAGNYYLSFETYHSAKDNKWEQFPNDNIFHHNLILHADAQGDRPGEDRMVYYEQENWGQSLAWVQEKYPRHFFANLEKNPRLADAENGDFRVLAGSPAIDAGDFLTRTTAAGANTRDVPVGDASVFCDGWGRIEGDLVQVGGNPPVRVVKVDEAARRITLERPISFAAGAPASLAWIGAGPDVGAWEAGRAGTPRAWSCFAPR